MRPLEAKLIADKLGGGGENASKSASVGTLTVHLDVATLPDEDVGLMSIEEKGLETAWTTAAATAEVLFCSASQLYPPKRSSRTSILTVVLLSSKLPDELVAVTAAAVALDSMTLEATSLPEATAVPPVWLLSENCFTLAHDREFTMINTVLGVSIPSDTLVYFT